MTAAEPQPLLSTAAVARELGVSTFLVRSLIEAGELSALDVSSATVPRYRVERRELDRFKTRRRVKVVNGENRENKENATS